MSPFIRFLLFASVLYLGWYGAYEFYLKEKTHIDLYVIDNLVFLAEGMLRAIGFDLVDFSQIDGQWRNHMAIVNTPGVTIGAPCDGIVLFALFVVFVVAFPGPWKHRAWFIPSGLFIIHLLNAMRVAALTIIVYWNEKWLSFNHDYTFTIVVYSVVMVLWWWWINGFSDIRKKASA